MSPDDLLSPPPPPAPRTSRSRRSSGPAAASRPVYDVEGFIARQALLSGGTLVDFSEWGLCGRAEAFGDVAHWFGSYAKAGVQDGTPFTGRGIKSLQLVRVRGAWRISAAAWDDERDGLALTEIPA